jgi:predicted esterase
MREELDLLEDEITAGPDPVAPPEDPAEDPQVEDPSEDPSEDPVEDNSDSREMVLFPVIKKVLNNPCLLWEGSEAECLLIHLHGSGEIGPLDGSQIDKVTKWGPLRTVKGYGPHISKFMGGVLPRFDIVGAQEPDWHFAEDNLKLVVDYFKSRKNYKAVVLMGLSAGAMNIYRFIEKYPGYVDGVVTICGRNNQWAEPAIQAFTQTPIYAFHGDKDPTVHPGPDQRLHRLLKEAGHDNMKLVIYPGVGHNCWSMTYNSSGMGKESPDYDPFDISVYDWALSFCK